MTTRSKRGVGTRAATTLASRAYAAIASSVSDYELSDRQAARIGAAAEERFRGRRPGADEVLELVGRLAVDELGEATTGARDGHWSQPAGLETDLAGLRYRGWDGATYRLESRHECGYHLKLVGGRSSAGRRRGEMTCVSERAIGRTFHEAPDRSGGGARA